MPAIYSSSWETEVFFQKCLWLWDSGQDDYLACHLFIHPQSPGGLAPALPWQQRPLLEKLLSLPTTEQPWLLQASLHTFNMQETFQQCHLQTLEMGCLEEGIMDGHGKGRNSKLLFVALLNPGDDRKHAPLLTKSEGL